MIINNNFSNDTNSERAERLQLLSTNIDTFAVELAIVPPRLTAAQTADALWDDACAAATVESGQKDEAYEEFNKVIVAAYDYYVGAKAYLSAIIRRRPHGDWI